jgi:hypothetical protein
MQEQQFGNEFPHFPHVELLGKALSKDRLGGICLIHLCGGGETLLPPEIIPIISALLKEGHYIWVVTNGTVTNRFNELVELPKEMLERLAFKFSFHYLELKRLNFMDTFFNNIRKIRNAGCSFSVELMPSDDSIQYIEDIKKVCFENLGAFCHVTVGRDNAKTEKPILTELTKDEYIKIWSTFSSKLFDYKISVFNIEVNEFCYAGDYTASLDIGTGDLKQCYKGKQIQNIYHDVKESIHWEPIGYNCTEPHCYNAHCFLVFGAIPELGRNAPTYMDVRNKICANGSEWLTPKMKAFIGQRIER